MHCNAIVAFNEVQRLDAKTIILKGIFVMVDLYFF